LGRSLVLLAFNSALGLSNVRVIQLLPIAGNLADLRHSRSQERAADRYALEVIVNHYGHGSRSLDFFEQLSQSELNWGALGSMAEWQSTHPLTPARLEQLKALAAAQNWPMEGEPTPLPARLHCADFADCEK
jgi:predicted Zn-dependent protease